MKFSLEMEVPPAQRLACPAGCLTPADERRMRVDAASASVLTAAVAGVAVVQQERHQDGRIGARPERVRLARRQDHQLAGPEAAHTARHVDLDVAFEAMDRALVVDVMLRQVAARRQHQMEQLKAIAFQQARADRVVQRWPERSDVDDVEQLGVGQGHGVLPKRWRASPVPDAGARPARRLPGRRRYDLARNAMNLTRVALTVGLACVAANLLMKSRRGEAGQRDDGLDPFPSVDPGFAGRMRAMPAGAETGTMAAGIGAAGTGSDSPNEAERLQASGVAAEDDDGSWTRDLFKSTSQESADARAPGLPDFARGA
jgi:hypothetical protein